MRESRWLSLSLALLFAVCSAGLARSQDLRINLCNEDDYATRRMQIVMKSGETMSDVLKIRSFDPQNNSFVLERLTGETVNLRASDMKKIDFQQEAPRGRSAAQVAQATIKAVPGSAFRYAVSQKALKIDSGDLVLPESSPREKISEPAAEPVKTSTEKAKIVGGATIPEARTLTYDPNKKSFFVVIQDVKYTKEMSGSSGASGIVK